MAKRRLIICLDGTFNDGINQPGPLTNVARISRCMEQEDRRDPNAVVSQIIYYRTGIGTGTSKWANYKDAIYGRGIDHFIREAYIFISQNYTSDADEIVLLGFSRGAFTARALAHLIDQFGVLRPSGLPHFHEIYGRWKHQHKHSTWTSSWSGEPETIRDYLRRLELQDHLRRSVTIKVCAVWDTVAALPGDELKFVDERILRAVQRAFHAIALNEERANYLPLLFKKGPPQQGAAVGPDLRQCWFLGTHSMVGGGSKEVGLSNVALAWMIDQLRDIVAFSHEAVSIISQEDFPPEKYPVIKTTLLPRNKTNLDGTQNPGPYTFSLKLPVRDAQSKTDIHLGRLEWAMRGAGFKLRQPLTGGGDAQELLHWSVPHLLGTKLVASCNALKKVPNRSWQQNLWKPSVTERRIYQAWAVRDCLRVHFDYQPHPDEARKILNPPDLRHPLKHIVPIYAVLADPDKWDVQKGDGSGGSLDISLGTSIAIRRLMDDGTEKDLSSFAGSATVGRAWLEAGPLGKDKEVLSGKITFTFDTEMPLV